MSMVLERTVISKRLDGSRISGTKTHFAVALVALTFTHVTSTLPVSPRRVGKTTPRRIVKKVGKQKTLPNVRCSVSGPCCVLLVLRAACATLCACCAHSSIGALPRLPHPLLSTGQPFILCPARLLLADDSLRRFEVLSCKRGSIATFVPLEHRYVL